MESPDCDCIAAIPGTIFLVPSPPRWGTVAMVNQSACDLGTFVTTRIEDQPLCSVAGHVEMAISHQMTKSTNLILRNPFAVGG